MATVVANSSAIPCTTAPRINAIAKPKPRKSWQRRKEARPAEILEAALEEFSQKGLGLSLDSAFRAPMAIAAIGGLVSSTALSLIFVPTMFSYVRDFEDWLRQKAKKIIS